MQEGVASAQSDFFFGDQVGRPPCPLPVFSSTTTTWAVPPASGLRVTWLGHSTTVIEIDGVVVLTDPQFSDFAAPFDAVVERFQPPPVPLDHLPPIDVVVISHDHYDHLDQKTVQRIAAERPSTTFFVPLGIGAHLERWGIPPARFREFDWGDEVDVKGVTVVSTPSRHFSGRALVDANRTLWTSWALLGPRHRVWFSGDTGLTPLFDDIGRQHGPFDVALVEIGQWNAAWGSIHLGPHGALRATKMVQARRLFPVHWGMFNLAVHDWSEPIETTVTTAAAAGVDVIAPQLALPIEPDAAPKTAWWRAIPPLAPACP